MKFAPDKCPECGKLPESMLEVVQGQALLFQDDPGVFEYNDTTDIDWNSQVPLKTCDGMVTIACEDGHTWPALLSEHPEDEEETL